MAMEITVPRQEDVRIAKKFFLFISAVGFVIQANFVFALNDLGVIVIHYDLGSLLGIRVENVQLLNSLIIGFLANISLTMFTITSCVPNKIRIWRGKVFLRAFHLVLEAFWLILSATAFAYPDPFIVAIFSSMGWGGLVVLAWLWTFGTLLHPKETYIVQAMSVGIGIVLHAITELDQGYLTKEGFITHTYVNAKTFSGANALFQAAEFASEHGYKMIDRLLLSKNKTPLI